MLRLSYCPALAASALLTAVTVGHAQQHGVTLNPFLAFLPTGNTESMTGLSLMLGGGTVAFRAGAQMALPDRRPTEQPATTMSRRPWVADLDALAYLDNLSYGELITFAPYVFVGVGSTAVDSGSLHVTRAGWSYGTGLSLPLGSAFGVYSEYRWRMSRFVSPSAPDAPAPTGEARIGLSFRIGAGGPGNDTPVISTGDAGIAMGPGSTRALAARVVSTASEYVGTRYRRGGASPNAGFDAAGFVRFVFSQLGIILPRTSRDQARVGERIPAEIHVIEAGDLLVFEDDGGINHVAIYVGGNRIIHSSETGGGVGYDDLSSERGRWFLERMVGVRRVSPELRGLLLDLARGAGGASGTEEGSPQPDRPDRAPRRTTRPRR